MTNSIIVFTIVLLVLVAIAYLLRRLLMPKHFLSSFLVLILSGALLGATAPGLQVPVAQAEWWNPFADSNEGEDVEISPVQNTMLPNIFES